MKTVWRFLVKFASLIVWKLDCFDRVIFKGHLALAAPRELEYFVDGVLKVRRSALWAQQLIRDQGRHEGRVGSLCTLETCPSFALVPGPRTQADPLPAL